MYCVGPFQPRMWNFQLLSMIMDTSLLYTVYTTILIKPVNPGAYTTVPIGATTSQIALIDCTQK